MTKPYQLVIGVLIAITILVFVGISMAGGSGSRFDFSDSLAKLRDGQIQSGDSPGKFLTDAKPKAAFARKDTNGTLYGFMAFEYRDERLLVFGSDGAIIGVQYYKHPPDGEMIWYIYDSDEMTKYISEWHAEPE